MYASKKSVNDVLDMEVEYSPSRNTNRFQDHENPNVKVVEHFLKVTKEETEKVRSKYQTRLNIRYGSNNYDNRLLDIYYKGEEKDSPLFVFIHGGYWQEMDKNTAGSFVAPLVERGYRVAVVDYNLCPTVTLEELVEQTLDFNDWIFNYAEETKASSISFCGHSAGSHLASFLLDSCKFPHLPGARKTRAFFLIGGVYDLRELWQLPCVNPGNILSLDMEKATKLSPLCWDYKDELIKYFSSGNIEIHILVGENDSSTFIGQSHAFYEKLKKLGFHVEFKEFENYDHFNILEEAAIDESAICRYVKSYL